MAHFCEFFGRLRTHAGKRCRLVLKFRKCRQNRIKPATQHIIVRIGDRRRVLLVVEHIVLGNFISQRLPFHARFQRHQLVNRKGPQRVRLGAHRAASIRRVAAARASSVISAPESIRAISSRRFASLIATIRVATRSPSGVPSFAIRKCRPARAATCGACVTEST